MKRSFILLLVLCGGIARAGLRSPSALWPALEQASHDAATTMFDTRALSAALAEIRAGETSWEAQQKVQEKNMKAQKPVFSLRTEAERAESDCIENARWAPIFNVLTFNGKISQDLIIPLIEVQYTSIFQTITYENISMKDFQQQLKIAGGLRPRRLHWIAMRIGGHIYHFQLKGILRMGLERVYLEDPFA